MQLGRLNICYWPCFAGSNVDTYSGIVDFARERKVADHSEAEQCAAGRGGLMSDRKDQQI